MSLILLIAALAVWGIVATFVQLPRDGFRAVETDWSRVGDLDRPGS